MNAPKTSAAYVSRRLRAAGFALVSGDRQREGIRVTKSVLGEVGVGVDLDAPSQQRHLAQLVYDELKGWEGYTIRRSDYSDAHFYVSKSAPAAPAERITPEPGKLNPWYLLGALGAHLDSGPLDIAAWNDAVASAEAYMAEHPERNR